MSEIKLTLLILREAAGICKLPADEPIPLWACQGEFFSITKTDEELSIVCAESAIPDGAVCEKGWKLLKIQGMLDFALVGILANVSTALAKAGISIFAVSTYNTDYILVKAADLDRAAQKLREQGHEVMI